MIKIKAKYDEEKNVFSVKCDSIKTFTLEHIALIEYLCEAILENDDNMTMKEIFELVETIKKNKEVI